jgi:hypothetical protein
LQNLDAALETVRANINILAKESCWKEVDQTKQAKLQWLQDPREMHGNNLGSNTWSQQIFLEQTEGISDRHN